MNVELLEQCETTTKKTAKVEILKDADEQFRRFITMAVSQDVTFGVTVDEDGFISSWSPNTKKAKDFWDQFEVLLENLRLRDFTGNTADDKVNALFACAPDRTTVKWACRILNRNLRAGFDISTCNKAWGKGAVKKFEVQLADQYEAQELEGDWIFEPKLDGNRVVGYRGQPTSRGNKLYPNAQPIFEQLRKIPGFFAGYVPDGEMMGNLGFDKSSGALRRSSDKGREKAEFTYWLFDMFTLPEYDLQATASLRKRKERLDEFFKEHGKDLPNVKPVPWFVIKNPTHKQVMAITEKFVADGFEGAMAKRLDAPAKFGRGPDLLKVKLFFEADLKVIGFYEGKGQHKGSLGGLIVEGEIKWSPTPEIKKQVYKIRSECGSGFGHKPDPSDPTKVLRQDVWKNQKSWLGAIVQVQFQEPTKKVNEDGTVSLRLPVFMMRRKDKE